MKLLDSLGAFLWPNNSCPICGRDNIGGVYFGRSRLCRVCGAEIGPLRCCPECAAFRLPGEEHCCQPVGIPVVAFAPYGGEVRRRLRDLKYHGQRRLARPLGSLAAAVWENAGHTADCIVPVPLFAARADRRGYNQSDLLADAVGREVGLPVLDKALVRVRDTAAQHSLSPEQRRLNVAGAFAGGPDIGGVIGRRVLLLDDIITTGATMQSCADVLLGYGAAEIYGLAVAGKRRDFD